MNQAQTIAAKDAEIGLLKADKYTDQKLSEVTAYLMGQIKDLSNEVRANKDEQAGVNMQQAVYNATNTAAISCLQNQVAALQGLTKLVIPNSSVCPGWGAVKVTPETAAAATA
jgi:ribosomal protein L29